jgi:hypothetical protein
MTATRRGCSANMKVFSNHSNHCVRFFFHYTEAARRGPLFVLSPYPSRFNPMPLVYFRTLDYSDCGFAEVTKSCQMLGGSYGPLD